MASTSISQLSNNSANKPTFSSLRNRPVVADTPDVATQAYIDRLQIPHYLALDTEGKLEHLQQFDALEMYNVMVEMKNELSSVKLENYILTDFLEKNDPKLLIGLRQRRNTASMRQQQRLTITSANVTPRSSAHNVRESTSRRSVLSISQSASTLGSMKKGNVDYRLNYKAKTEMAEKVCADLERKLKKFQDTATKDIKSLKANIEEMRHRKDEADETANNFILHFLTDPRDIAFLETATEKQIERKFRKFENNWMKNARTLLGTMRLRITNVQESCHYHRSILLEKSDLSGILGAIDFEQLKIKRAEYRQEFKEKNACMAGLKAITGKASLSMGEEKKEMANVENKSQKLLSKTVEVIKAISKLEKESSQVEKENNKDEETLSQLKKKLALYDAPSVNEYMEQKNELVSLEKEDKVLERKISILEMTLKNSIKKYRRGTGQVAPTSTYSSSSSSTSVSSAKNVKSKQKSNKALYNSSSSSSSTSVSSAKNVKSKQKSNKALYKMQ